MLPKVKSPKRTARKSHHRIYRTSLPLIRTLESIGELFKGYPHRKHRTRKNYRMGELNRNPNTKKTKALERIEKEEYKEQINELK